MNIFKLFGSIGIKNDEANKAIDDTVGKAGNAQSKLSGIFRSIGGFALKAGKVIATGMAIGTAALASLTGVAVKHYADYEQLVGGVETLFGAGGKSIEEYAQSVGQSVEEAKDKYDALMSAQDEVLKNSKNAFKTAGLSANAYMETVTSFSASLIQSLNGDTVAAAKKADMAIVDMSDNANKMGTSMEAIQNAYQGFAKQNYTMLDNLKLGYGGTKEEMQRLLEDSEKISGIKYDISSYADVVDAIHVMQESMGIAGTTAKEAASTISGSIGMTKAAWVNFLTGMADSKQDIGQLVNDLVFSAGSVMDNLIPRIAETAPRLIAGLSQLFSKASEKLPELIGALLPPLMTGAISLFAALFTALPAIIHTVLFAVLPQVATAFIQFLDGVFEAIPEPFKGLKRAYDNIKQIFSQLGAVLGDFLKGLAGADEGVSAMDKLTAAVSSVTDFLGDATGAVNRFIQWLRSGEPSAQSFQAVVVALVGAFAAFKTILFVKGVITGITTAFAALKAGFIAAQTGGAAVSGTMGTLGGVIGGLSAPVLAVIATIAGLVAIFVGLYNTNEEFRVKVQAVWAEVKSTIGTAIQEVSGFVMSIFGGLVTWWNENQELIRSTADRVWKLISNVIMTVLRVLTPWIQAAWNNIKTIISTAWSVIKTVVTTAINVILGIIKAVMQIINGDWSGAWETIKQTASAVWEGIKSIISSAISGIASIISNTMEGIVGTVSNIWDNIKNTISNAINSAKDTVSSVIDTIKGLFNFEWSLPKPKLPKITMDGGEAPWGFGGKGKLPSLGIEWFAKGGIMTRPTLFGMNGDSLMAGGEAGPEAVLPLNRKTLGGIGEGILESGDFSQTPQHTFNITINVDGRGVDDSALIKKLSRELEKVIVRSVTI